MIVACRFIWLLPAAVRAAAPMKHQMMGMDGSLHDVAPGAYSHFANLMAGVLMVRCIRIPIQYAFQAKAKQGQNHSLGKNQNTF